jgi:NADPH2:quinone reductase
LEKNMQAAVIDSFGGPDRLEMRETPVPEIAPDQVLIRVEYAGIGQWDPFEREGGYAQMLGIQPVFPYILGSEGCGVIAAIGAQVTGLKIGDPVFAPAFLNPKGGFYAQYTAVDADLVFPVPENLSPEQAAVISGVGLTALRGLSDVLDLKKGESIAILGAGGGIGHIAVQIALQLGARIFAVASGSDGVELVKSLGVDAAVDGRKADPGAAAKSFGFNVFDTVLLTAGGQAAEELVRMIRPGGRGAYPFGIDPAPGKGSGITLSGYNGEPDADIVNRLHELLAAGLVYPHVHRVFPLAEAREAHLYLDRHFPGKLALLIP